MTEHQINIITDYWKTRTEKGMTGAEYLKDLDSLLQKEAIAMYEQRGYKSIDECKASAKSTFVIRRKELSEALEADHKATFGRAKKEGKPE